MKVSKMISILFIFVTVTNSAIVGDKRRFSISDAFESIANKIMETEHEVFILNYNFDWRVIDSNVLKNLKNKNIPFKFKTIRTTDPEKETFHTLCANSSLIITVESLDSLNLFNLKYLNLFYPQFEQLKQINFFVYCWNCTVQDIPFVIREKIKTQVTVHLDYYVVETPNAVKLLTFTWFSPGMCNKLYLFESNSFSKDTGKWENPNLTVNKNNNLHGCQLLVAYSSEGPLRLDPIREKPSRKLDCHFKILTGLTRLLNFTLVLAKQSYNNETKKLVVEKPDLRLVFKASDENSMYSMFCMITRPYLFEDLLLAVPIGEDYDAYEKLLLPFDSIVWTLIIVAFSSAFLTVFVMGKFSNANTRQFITGSEVSMPALNIARVFFGIGLTRLPGRNFARFLLMAFSLYSLVIRTAYQGKMFEFMQKEMRKPEVQSIDEIIAKNYTFYMRQGFNVFYKEMEFVKK